MHVYTHSAMACLSLIYCTIILIRNYFNLQAFIHPFLARLFWSSVKPDPRALIWSPYEYCNGTFSATKDHSFLSYPSDTNLGEIVFIDFAGAGLVHLCGEFLQLSCIIVVIVQA